MLGKDFSQMQELIIENSHWNSQHDIGAGQRTVDQKLKALVTSNENICKK